MDPVSFIATMAIESAVNFGISYLFPSQGPRLKDLTVSASSYGVAIPQLFGTARAAGNLIWSATIQEHKQKKSQGKGGSYIDYTYTCSFAYAFCAGPAQAVIRLYADGKVIYDLTGLSAGVVNSAHTLRFYLGDETQVPDPLIEASVGIGNTPAYRGLCYVVFQDFLLTNYGNRVPTLAAEVTLGANNTTPYSMLSTVDFSNTTLVGYGNPGAFAGAVVDTLRGEVYVQGTGEQLPSGQVPTGLYRFDETTGMQDLEVLSSNMGIPPHDPDPTSPNFYNSGTMSNIIGCDPATGALYANVGGFNGQQLVKIDPTSYEISAIWGSFTGAGNSGSNTPPAGGGAAYREMVFAADDSSCLHFDVYGFTQMLDPSTLEFIELLDNHGSELTFHPIVGCCPYNASGYAFLVNPDDSHLALYDDTGALLFAMTGTNLTGGWCIWDQGTAGIIFAYTDSTGPHFAKYSVDTGELAWTIAVAGYYNVSGNSQVLNNTFGWAINGATGVAYLLNTVDGTFINRDASQNALIPEYDINLPQYQPNYQGGDSWPLDSTVGEWQFYDGLRQAIVTNGTTNVIVNAGLGAGASTTLGAIVQSLFYQAGLSAGDFDVSDLQTTIVNGYGFANNSDIKGVLAELRQIYLFDVFESDNIMKSRMRGAASPDVMIDARCLGSSSPDVSDFWKQTRIQEADLPSKITLAFMDVNNDMLVSTVHYSRPQSPIPTMFSHQQAAIEANLVLDATTANKLVRSMIYTQWTERNKHETRLPWAYCHLDPSDLLGVTMVDGRFYFERLDSVEIGADLSIVASTFSQDASVYEVNSRIIGDGGGPSTPNVVTMPEPAVAFIMNTPLLRDSDDLGGKASVYYGAVGNNGGYGSAFQGATCYRATNGLDYELLFGNSQDVEWGVVRGGAIPAPPRGPGGVDMDTKITIVPATSAFLLESITDDQLWSGANPLVIGNEVICFGDAVQNTDNSWTISRLLRGRRGTEWACGLHTVAERVIAPSATSVLMQNESLDARGQNRWFKGVGQFLSIASGQPFSIEYMPRDLMPYTVSDIRRYPATSVTTFAGRTIGDFLGASGEDMKIDWSRRTRMGGGLMDGTGVVPLNETSEAYEVYILAAPFAGDASTNDPPVTFVRMASVTSPTFTYTAAMQTIDGYVQNLDTVHLVIYQVSGAVGRGFPSPRDIEPFRNF